RLRANDVDGARKAFEESLQIGRTLIVLEPDLFAAQEVLAAALGRLAQVNVKAAAWTQARGQLEEAIALLRRLIARNAAENLRNAVQSERLLISFQSQLGQLGDLLVQLKESAAVIPVYRERVEIQRKLLEVAPDEISRHDNLSSRLDELGNQLFLAK